MSKYSLFKAVVFMARPLSEAKRDAILAAAIAVVAALGTGAATAKIAKEAGVAEGTLFTYFSTKDELLKQLYLRLKADLAEAMLQDYPGRTSLQNRFAHVWDRYIDWGRANPAGRKAMRQLAVSNRIDGAVRKAGALPFESLGAALQGGITEGTLRGPSVAFVGSIMESLAETTLEFMTAESATAESYKREGFAALWGAISVR